MLYLLQQPHQKMAAAPLCNKPKITPLHFLLSKYIKITEGKIMMNIKTRITLLALILTLSINGYGMQVAPNSPDTTDDLSFQALQLFTSSRRIRNKRNLPNDLVLPLLLLFYLNARLNNLQNLYRKTSENI